MTVTIASPPDIASTLDKRSTEVRQGAWRSHAAHESQPASPPEWYTLTRGKAAAVSAAEVSGELLAETELASQVCDHRYYDVVHRTLGHDFALRYFVIYDRAGAFRGAQPFFVVEQNILAGVRGMVAGIAEKVRAKYPRFMTLKTLMLGNPAGPGALGVTSGGGRAEHSWFVAALAEALAAYGRRHKVRIVVFKDFPAEHRGAMSRLTEAGSHGGEFVRLPSMPMTGLSLGGYSSFEDYMTQSLSKVMRKGLRRKFKRTAEEKIEFSVTGEADGLADEIHGLYRQVYDRASLKFEKLTPHYFRELSRRMPDRAKFFLWRRHGKLVAASVTLARLEGPDSALYDLYLGMEYPLALDLSLYFLTMRDVVQWCIDNKVATYYSTPLNYDSKLHLRHRLVPLDLYVRHTSPVLNPGFKLAMHFAEPTRHDKILPQFANFRDLKGTA